MNSIELDALTLEPQVAAHAAEMFAVLSDPAIYEFENQAPPSVQWLHDRFAKLESRGSPDGRESWLNWVIRLRGGEVAGYLQATVYRGTHADIAYEMSSRFWGRGLATLAVQAMIDELMAHHGVRELTAILKCANHRSLRLLQRLGFAPASPAEHQRRQIEPDEWLMQRACDDQALCIRLFLPTDIAAARGLWQHSAGVGLSDADEPAELDRYLARNPGISLVATRGPALVATLLCGHDGRRGLIHHLVVAPDERRRGLARALLARGLAALRDAGIHKCHLMVFQHNAAALAFWQSVGARQRLELALWSLSTQAEI
jgi:RimJ/RimL family protein N-acetyltransferase